MRCKTLRYTVQYTTFFSFIWHQSTIHHTTPHDTTQYPTTCSSPSLRSPPSNIESLQDPLQSQLRFSSCPPCVAMIQQPLFDMLRCIFAKYVPRLVRHFFFFFFFPDLWSMFFHKSGFTHHFFVSMVVIFNDCHFNFFWISILRKNRNVPFLKDFRIFL